MTAGERPGEFELIARVFAPLAGEGAFGLTDDAARLTPPPGHDLVLTTDALGSGVHFFPEDPWDAVAQKALRVNLSDLAAKGARPLGYLLALGLPDDWRTEDVEALGLGLSADQQAYGVALLGGDTVRSPERLTLSITAVGAVPSGRMVRRAGARPGDVIVVTGSIGDAAIGLKLRLDPTLSERLGLDDEQRAHLLDRYLLPRPRLAVAEAVVAHALASMDVSDGLAGDLQKMAAASGVGIAVDATRVPLSPAARAAIEADPALLVTALSGGDDYEVAVAVPQESVAAYVHDCAAAGVEAVVIGMALEGSGVVVVGPDDQPMDLGTGSFAHF